MLLDLPKTQNETKEYTLSGDPLGCNLYFSIDSLVVSTGEKLKSEMFLSMHEIVRVYVDNDYSTRVVIRCKEATSLNLSAHLNVRYIKQYAEKLEIDITCSSAVAADAVTVEFPALKYNKDTLVSFTTDDSNILSCLGWHKRASGEQQVLSRESTRRWRHPGVDRGHDALQDARLHGWLRE